MTSSAKTVVTGIFLCGTLVAGAVPTGAGERLSYRFNFSNAAAPGATSVQPTNIYSDSIGYGFEPVARVVAGNGCITGTNSFYFSVKLPEGNYRVTVTVGDSRHSSATTVKAELRRLMLYHIQTAPGQFVTRSFIVNVRTPEITGWPLHSGSKPGDNGVRLKPREKANEWWDWDDKLSLEFDDVRPCIR